MTLQPPSSDQENLSGLMPASPQMDDQPERPEPEPKPQHEKVLARLGGPKRHDSEDMLTMRQIKKSTTMPVQAGSDDLKLSDYLINESKLLSRIAAIFDIDEDILDYTWFRGYYYIKNVGPHRLQPRHIESLQL